MPVQWCVSLGLPVKSDLANARALTLHSLFSMLFTQQFLFCSFFLRADITLDVGPCQQEHEQGQVKRRGGETTVAVARLQHFSSSPVASCAARCALERERVKCAVAEQGCPEQDVAENGGRDGA